MVSVRDEKICLGAATAGKVKGRKEAGEQDERRHSFPRSKKERGGEF